MKRLIALFIVLCILVLQLPTGVSALETDESSGKRYTVLALDVSGSMNGEPLEAEKQAALKFCESMFEADGENYAALVKYSSCVIVKKKRKSESTLPKEPDSLRMPTRSNSLCESSS